MTFLNLVIIIYLFNLNYIKIILTQVPRWLDKKREGGVASEREP